MVELPYSYCVRMSAVPKTDNKISLRSAIPKLEINNNNNNNNNVYLQELGCHPVAVVILHVYKI